MFTEILYVLALSRKTQIILIVGAAFFAGLMIGGKYAVKGLDLKSLPAPIAEAIREKVLHRYDKAAWAILGVSMLGAIKAYRNDRKRLGFREGPGQPVDRPFSLALRP